MLGWLLAIALLATKLNGSSSSSSSSPAWAVRFVAGTTIGEITLLPVPRWSVRRGSSVLSSGTAPTFEDAVRPMLEAFAAATPNQPAQGIFLETSRSVTVSVFEVYGGDLPWGWTITDGIQAVTAFASSRGVAILDAVARAAGGQS